MGVQTGFFLEPNPDWHFFALLAHVCLGMFCNKLCSLTGTGVIMLR